MEVKRGDYIKLKNGRTGQVVGDGKLRSASGDTVEFQPGDVRGWAEWSAIEAYKQAQLPKRVVGAKGTRMFEE